jgi:hypothetical protein
MDRAFELNEAAMWLHSEMAPEVGLEPTTPRLTAGCSTIELLRKKFRAQAKT